MASPTPSTKSLAKREPVVVGSAAVTLLSTLLYIAPAFGLKVPPKAAQVVSLLLTLGSGLGVRNLVKPV